MDYFSWLVQYIDGEYYTHLLSYLHSVEFYALIDRDENRAADGVALREEYFNEYPEEDFDEGECSVLEMLIGVAKRFDFEVSDEDNPMGITLVFWEMMSNWNVEKFNDEMYDQLNGNATMKRRVDTLLKRTYKFNGKGGLFPLRNPRCNQTEIEIWAQMQAYILENYTDLFE